MAGVPTSARASVACSLSVEASLLDVHSEEASLPFASQSSPDERTGGKSRLKTVNGRARLRYRTSTLDVMEPVQAEGHRNTTRQDALK